MGKRRKYKGKNAGNREAESKGRNQGGRPTVMTPEIVQKLELGFMAGLNDTECSQFAGISRSTLNLYCKNHPEFSDRKEELKSKPSATAKLNITMAIENGDLDMSKWWLERRNKAEFSTKQEVDGSVKVTTKLEDLLL